MTVISIEDIQSDLLAYLQQVEQAGETLVITRSGKPVAEIRPIAAGARSPRPFGLCAGQFTVPDDFDDPLPEELLRQFPGVDGDPPADRVSGTPGFPAVNDRSVAW